MADKKISALTAATTPLVGSEVLPIVQSGNTVKVSVADLTAGRTTAMSLLDVENSAGGGLLGTFKSNWSATKLSIVGDGVTGSAVLNVSDLAGTTPYGFKVKANGTETLDVDTSGNITALTGNLVVGTAGKGIDFSANTHAAGMTSELLDWYEEGTWTPTFTTWSVAPTNVAALYTRVGRQVTLNMIAQGGTCAAGNEIGGIPFSAGNAASSALAHDENANSIAFTGVLFNLDNKISSLSAATLGSGYWGLSVTYFV